MALTFRHPFVNGHADGADATLAQPSNWNADHVLAGGTKGALLVFDATQTIGVNSVAAVAVGQVLVSAGTTTLPLWSAIPTLTSIGISGAGTITNTGGAISVDANFIPSADGGNNLGTSSKRWSTVVAQAALVVGTNPATAGGIRLPDSTGVQSRNAANTANYGLITGLSDTVYVSQSTIPIVLDGSSVRFSQVGPHAIGGATNATMQLWHQGTFTSPTANVYGYNLNPSLTQGGANGTMRALSVGPGTFTTFSSGTSRLYVLEILTPTVSSGGATIDNTASLYIAGAMSATVTGKNYAAWVAGGDTRLDGLLMFNGATNAFPAFIRNSTQIDVVLADNSGLAFLRAATLTVGTNFTGPGTTAGAGDWRAQNGFSFYARNAANSANQSIMRTDVSDLLWLGEDGTVNGPTKTVLQGARVSSGSDPAAPSSTGWRLYARDNGAGKTQLCARFDTGAVQVIATQP